MMRDVMGGTLSVVQVKGNDVPTQILETKYPALNVVMLFVSLLGVVVEKSPSPTGRPLGPSIELSTMSPKRITSLGLAISKKTP
jgi:hypothetical protein